MDGPYFRIQDPDDPIAAAAKSIVECEYAIYSRFAREEAGAFDLDEVLRVYMAATSKGKISVENGIFAYQRLADLPRLRELQDREKLLDITRLTSVTETLARLGNRPDPAVLAQADALLVELFTPSKRRQALPGPKTVTRRLASLLGQLNPATDFNPDKRKEREDNKRPHETTSVEFYDIAKDDQVQAGVLITTDSAVMASFKLRIAMQARDAGCSLAQAAEQLLIGTAPPAKIVLYGYTPLGADGQRAPGTPVYLPDEGWTSGDGTATLEEWMETTPTTVVNLDEVRHHRVGGYAPSEKMRVFCAARDGVCIYPGCNQPAERCQLDHRIPYDEGGPTTPDNLFSLCQHHHNLKTARTAFYVPDPATGDIVWLFSDGTYLTVEQEGLLTQQVTPGDLRWQETVGARGRRKAKNAQFFATGHRILDDYHVHRDKERAAQEIAELEAAFGMSFEFPLDKLPPDVLPGELDDYLQPRPVNRIKELLNREVG